MRGKVAGVRFSAVRGRLFASVSGKLQGLFVEEGHGQALAILVDCL